MSHPTGIRESQYSPAAATRAPPTISGRVPTRAISCEEIPAEMMTPNVSGRYAAPV